MTQFRDICIQLLNTLTIFVQTKPLICGAYVIINVAFANCLKQLISYGMRIALRGKERYRSFNAPNLINDKALIMRGQSKMTRRYQLFNLYFISPYRFAYSWTLSQSLATLLNM